MRTLVCKLTVPMRVSSALAPRSAWYSCQTAGNNPSADPGKPAGRVCPLVYPRRCSSVSPSGPQKPSLSLPRSQLSMGNTGGQASVNSLPWELVREGTCSSLGLQQRPETGGWRLTVPPTLRKPAALSRA